MLLSALLLCVCIHFTYGQVIVSQVMPNIGSINGATRITIKGNGFAEANQFNYGDGNDNLGNSVQLVSSTLSIPCDVEKDASHSTQITCYTRPMPTGSYTVRVSVDGVPVDTSNICGGYYQYSWCMFQTHIYYTPVIDTIAPVSGTPGSLITITGKIFTDVYGSNTALSSNGKNVRVLRVYAGGMPCELLIPNSDTLYGLQLDSPNSDTGSMICRPTGTYVGHKIISFILDGNYGRSLPDLDTYFVSSLNKIAMFQTYAEITGIFPSAGGIKGGTIITITGQFFDETDAPAKVLIGGQECQVLTLTNTAITCRSPPQLSALPSLYPGNRGLKLERWNINMSPSNALQLNETSTGYAGSSWSDGASKSWPSDSSEFVARLSGFFVPPETDYYNFYVKGYYNYALYFNESGDPAGKVQIAYGSATNYYTSFSYQKSKNFYLQKEKPCYLEAYIQNYGGAAALDVGLYSQKSQYTEQQTPDAVNDVQGIQSYSTTILETQVVTVQNWNKTQQAINEVQTINITKYCISSCPNMYYKLIHGNEETDPLSADATALQIQAALNKLWSIQPDTVSVLQESFGEENVYTVTFNSQRGDFPLLSYIILDGSNITVDITEKTKGVPDMKTFTLVWDNVYSSPLPANASSLEVQNAVMEIVSSQCPDAIAKQKESSSVKYFRNYETDFNPASTRGTLTMENEPFCGRYSLKNPQILYDYTEVKSVTQSAYGYILLGSYSKLCFAYKGFLINTISLTFQYEDSSSLGTVKTITDSFMYDFIQGNSWTYTCIDLWQLVKTKYTGRNFNVLYIYLQSSQDYYVDVLYIGQTVTTSDINVPRRRSALSQSGKFINYVNVTKSDDVSKSQYTITVTALNCAYNFPLFAVGFAENILSTSGSAIYTTPSWPQDTKIQINRTQTASPPIGGTFTIRAYGKETSDLSVDISSTDLKYALQTIPEIGQVSIIYSSGSCKGYNMRIKFLTAAGYHPLLQVNDSKVTGIQAKASAYKVTNGGLFRQKLLGDFVRTSHENPQVEVYINGIPSKCSGNCDYVWDQEHTPIIYSVSTDVSGEDEFLIINGTGFLNSTANDNTYVTAGNITCTVLDLTDTTIRCQVQKASAGTFPISVYIAERGIAESQGGNLTFTYPITVASITPSSGSSAGGTLVTILGSGFGNDSVVEIGGSECAVVLANLSMITCRTSAGPVGNADVVVFTNGLNGTLQDAFNFTSFLAPTIMEIHPNTSSVLGNTTLTILGFDFQNQSAVSAVFIKNETCQLLEWTPTNITCRLPALPPGKYNILVHVENWGFAISSNDTDASVEYILEVNSISPQYGSLYGGSRVTLTGSGFSLVPNENQVQIGSLPCNISTSSDHELICVIQRPGAVYNVTNDGKDSVYGVGYAWSPSQLVISTGDTVVWQWHTQPMIQGIGYRVFSVSDPANFTHDGISFNSGARSSSGFFSYQFTSAGTYYYSSGYVNDAQTLYMQGVVKVIPISDQSSPVHVYLGGVEATIASALIPTTTPSDCVTADPDCPALPSSPVSNTSIWFGFSDCYSPTITSITPSSGTIYDSITINGTQFSNLTCANQVLVGKYPCVVSSADENTLTCKVDPQDSMDIGMAEMVSVTVTNLGNAINMLRNEMDRRFALLPHIDYISPNNGSITGSTRVTIHGSGFINGSTIVLWLDCNFVSVNYTDIVCDTLPSYSHRVDVGVTVKGIAAQCIGSCSFTFSSERTPQVSSVYPTEVRNVTTVYINGLGFGEDINDVIVYIGEDEVDVVDVNDTEIICNIDPIPAGYYLLRVIVRSKGLAQGSFTVNSPAEADLMTPSGSVVGGTLLIIQGNGFHPTNTTVEVGGAPCPVTTVTPHSVQCISPPSTTAKTATLNINIPSASYPPLSFSYSESDTPNVTSVFPTTGRTKKLDVVCSIPMSHTNFCFSFVCEIKCTNFHQFWIKFSVVFSCVSDLQSV